MIRNTFARALAFLALASFAASPALPQSQINLNTQVKGVLPVANGGTNNTTGQAASTASAVTVNASGAGAAPGATFNGSAPITISTNSIGAQPALVSGASIKTVNSTSLLGSGDVAVGTVTSVGGTGTASGLSLSGTVTTTGNLTLGGTLAVVPGNFASQTAATVLAAPNGVAGVPTFRALVAGDIPTLNQNTTGTAATITGIYGASITSSQVTTGLGYTPLNPGTSQTAATFYAAPNGVAGAPAFRAIVAADVPTLNQSTTGSAATLTTPRTITTTGDLSHVVTFDGSANVTAAGTIAAGAVSLAKMANLPANTFIGNNTGIAATPIALTAAQATAALNTFTNLVAGTVAASGGGTANFLRADGTWVSPPNSGGTVTSVAALTLGTTGTDLSSSVATGTTTPVITLNVPTASAANRGALSAADWSTFNGKGSGSVTSVGGTGTVNGLTLTGTVTTSGNLTLGGALDLSAPPAIGGTAAAAGSFTTLGATGLLTTAASATGSAGIRLPHGAAPTTPTNGDLWSTTAGFFGRVNGATVGPFGAGGGTPGGSTTQIQYNNAGAFAGAAGITTTGTELAITSAANAVPLTVSGYSVTGAATTAMLSTSGTLNTTGAVDVDLMSITNTASNSASTVINRKVGGTSVFKVDLTGNVTANRFGADTNNYVQPLSSGYINLVTAGTAYVTLNNANNLYLGSGTALVWTNNTSSYGQVGDTFMRRRGAANIQFGAADAAAPVAQTISVQSVVAGTTNTAGVTTTLTGSQGTGTGNGGDIVAQVALPGTTGTAQNALVNAVGLSGTTGAFGYVTGIGGAVTQVTSRTTGVTINKPSFALTLVSAAGTTSAQSITITDSAISATDAPYCVQKSGTDTYRIATTAVAAGSFRITYATDTGTTTEQPVFNCNNVRGSAN